MGDVVVFSQRGVDIYTHGDFEGQGVYFPHSLFGKIYLRIPLFQPWGLVSEGFPYVYIEHPDIEDARKQEEKSGFHSVFVNHGDGESELPASTLRNVASQPIRVASFVKVLPRDDPSGRLLGSEDFLVFHDWRITIDGVSRPIEGYSLLPRGFHGER